MENIFNEIFESLEFDDKQTSDTERFGIYRMNSTKGCIEIVKLYKEVAYQPHIHDHVDAQFIFVLGKGKVILGDQKIPYAPGSKATAMAGVLHGFELEEDTIFISIQTKPIQDRITGEIDIRY